MGTFKFDLARTSFGLLIAASFAFVLFPLAVLLYMSLTAGDTLTFPVRSFSLRWYLDLLENRSYVNAAETSLTIALAAATLSTLLGGLLAYAVYRYTFRFKTMVYGLAVSPFFFPPVTLGVAFLNLFLPLHLAETMWAVIIAHSVFIFPFPFVMMLAGLGDISEDLENAAMSLGAPPKRVFTTIIFPLVRPSLIAGFIFAFGMSFNEFIIAQLIAGYTVTTLTIQIFSSLRYSLSPFIAAVSVLMILATMILVILASKVSKREDLFG